MAQGVMEMSRKRKRWRECREGEDEGERKKWEEGDLLINHSGMPADMAATGLLLLAETRYISRKCLACATVSTHGCIQALASHC